jgi:hypothetical protein
VARQYAGDPLVGINQAFGPEMFKAGDGRRRGRLTAQAVFADNRLGIENLFIGDGTDDAVADIDCPQAFF